MAMVGVFEHYFHVDFIAFQLHAAGDNRGQPPKLGGGNAGIIKVKGYQKATVAVDDAQAGIT